MLFVLEKGMLKEADAPAQEGTCVGLFYKGESFPEKLLSSKTAESFFQNPSTRFESRGNLDALRLNLPDHRLNKGKDGGITVFLTERALLMFCDNERLLETVRGELCEPRQNLTVERILSAIFEGVLSEDAAYLSQLEKDIEQLEDDVLLDRKQKDCTKRILRLRKRLMSLKRHYEKVTDVFDRVLLNENGLLSDRGLKLLQIPFGRAGRLYREVLHLLDYVTQVREAYQAEVDLNLNQTMKLFTVLAAVFLPLTLIVGWYGMNFDMPEYRWAWGYPVVIVVSILVVVACILYFKRKKWF